MMTEEPYLPKKIEEEAQRYWEEKGTFEVHKDENKEKFYCLAMFPYPSGKLHMGHVRNYTISDVIARYQRMLGKNVLHPMGWDSFGLPAENAAILNKTAPALWTRKNIDHMRAQLKALGYGIDWSRELSTCEPEYYKWEQWFFTKLYKRGLVYKKVSSVNWCPNDATVLANEQVIDGRCWRCDAVVQKKEIPQWFIRITDYAEQLLEDLNQLNEWPEKVVTMQRNWIGKSNGLNIRFPLIKPICGLNHIEVYTTRPDTLMGVTYLCLASEHPIALKLAEANLEIETFLQLCIKERFKDQVTANPEKLGIDTGIMIKHPLSGERVPIWITNYVLMEYGSGAVMAVPAHDQRDYEFAKKYKLPIKSVIKGTDTKNGANTGTGTLINSGTYDGTNFKTASNMIARDLSELDLGSIVTRYRLRDWGISRQRYWGTPIPMYNLPFGGEIPVPLDRLPVLLPEDVIIDGITSPLKTDIEWRKTSHDGQMVEKETDTFDTFMESSWYYARFTCSNTDDAMLNSELANYWLPVDQYVGGIEHAILHLLYARFFHKLMRDDGMLNTSEPFKRLLCQGMVLSESFYREIDGRKRWLASDEVSVTKNSHGEIESIFEISTGDEVFSGGITKMSKSKNNGVDPKETIDRYGADAVRMFTMFAAPPEQTLEWNNEGVKGAARFLKKIWNLVSALSVSSQKLSNDFNDLTTTQADLRQKTHTTIAKVTDDFGRRNTFNTAIAAIMELINATGKLEYKDSKSFAVYHEALTTSLLLLSPIAPHICHSLWMRLGFSEPIADASWPIADDSIIKEKSKEIVIQVNGKVRGKIKTSDDYAKAELEKLAFEEPNVRRFIINLQVRKVIYIQDKLINIVTN
ncbi:MAG: leucine--tRNA ligase [Porticoccaceae bacterium]|nr:leucine--tRNA ligase [Porticoccaceae bacterium]|tara:strand:- start:3305 stop:5887 length:2583 start_codon:yes stop_codon:yes gene_type:complete